jgi:hypothetical protein
MEKYLPAPRVLRQILSYDAETGRLVWKRRSLEFFYNGNNRAERTCRSWNTRYEGKEAFTCVCNGYKTGAVFGKALTAHRVIWAIVKDHWPTGEIDHVNGNRSDNRIENLRCVSFIENQRNRAIPKNNTSGSCGVYWDKSRDKWKAAIYVNGRAVNLGRFNTFDEAVFVRKSAEKNNSYHKNHGRKA